MDDLLFLTPVFKERIWGGQQLHQVFGYDLPYAKTGECWAISAHDHGSSIIKNGTYQGMTLKDVYAKARHLFDDGDGQRFPLLVKIIDAQDDLSVQVHPDDAYAMAHANDLGKTECWLVLEAAPDATIIHGHRAKTKEALKTMIEEGRWQDLLIERPVKKGDVIFVPAGTIHALGKGVMVLEVQQSSDTTYRLYDHDRVDDTGKQRPLHLEAAIQVTTVPHQDIMLEPASFKNGMTRLITNNYFTMEHWLVQDKATCPNPSYLLVSVLDGHGQLNGQAIQKGDHLIVTNRLKQVAVQGPVEMVVTYVTPSGHEKEMR